MSKGTGRSAGNCGTISVSAWGPPVEMPRATTCGGPERKGRGERGRRGDPEGWSRLPFSPSPFLPFSLLPTVEDLLDAAAAGVGRELGPQFPAQVLDVGRQVRAAGLEDEVEGPGLQRGNRGLGSLRREGTEHDRARGRFPPAELLEHGLAVHLRHLQVEHQQVGGLLVEPLQGNPTIGCRADDLHVRTVRKHVARRSCGRSPCRRQSVLAGVGPSDHCGAGFSPPINGLSEEAGQNPP